MSHGPGAASVADTLVSALLIGCWEGFAQCRVAAEDLRIASIFGKSWWCFVSSRIFGRA